MTNKASLLLAALLVIPAAAVAQTAPIPPSGAPVTPPDGAMMRHRLPYTQADIAKLRAEVDKMRAAHKATRAKILAALTPAHRAWLGNLLGQLAIAPNPDPEAARTKIDATLSATEKTNILTIHKAAMDQSMATMKMMPGMGGANMRYKRVIVVKNANGATTTTSSSSSSDSDGMPMKSMHAITAGEILMHLAGGEETGGMPMMWRHPHPMMPAVTPAPEATP